MPNANEKRAARLFNAGVIEVAPDGPLQDRRGRFTTATNPRRKMILVRFTDAEHQRIMDAAKRGAGMSVSNYLRHCGLGMSVPAKADLEAVSELRRQGGLMKLLAMKLSEYPGNDELSQQLKEQLTHVNRVLIRLASDSQ